MCGIIAAINHNGISVNGIIENAYKFQRSRGTEGFGFTEVLEDDIFMKRFTEEDKMLEHLKSSTSPFILFHHRIPTSTTNNVVSNHPMFTDSKVYECNYHLIHNGHIMNSRELRKEHEKLGIKYNSDEGTKFTDSESLMHELALIIEGKKEYKDFKAEGGLAFIMIQTDKLDNPLALYYGRNYKNPLKIMKPLEGLVVLSSENISGIEVPENRLYRYDYKTKEETFNDVTMGERPKLLTNSSRVRNNFAEVIKDLFESRMILDCEIERLTDKEKTELLIIAKRLAGRQMMEYEQNLLTMPQPGLYMLQNHLDSTMKVINMVENKLK